MGTVSAHRGFCRVPQETNKMFSHVLSAIALASMAVAAPQYYNPGSTYAYYMMAPAVAVPAVAPSDGQLAGLSSLAGLLPGLKALTAQATAQTPASLAALNQIQGATLNLLNKVPLESIPTELRADVATLIHATQQLGVLNQQTKAANQPELDKVLAASNNLLAALPA